MSLDRLALSDKSIPLSRVYWDPEDGDELGFCRFQVALEISGVTEAGLVLSGGACEGIPDRNVCFEVCALGHQGRRRIPLMRAEWRSVRGGHTNQRRNKCCGPWARKRVPETHIHTFEGNWIAEKEQMRRGDLPCAEGIPEELQTFEEFRAYVGTAFKINNIDVVSLPLWRYDLFAR